MPAAHAAPDTFLPLGDAVVVSLLAVTAWGYIRGLRGRGDWAGARQVVGGGRAAAFGAGLTMWATALSSPAERLAETLFSAHMGQHLLLALVGTPLVLLGRPTAVFPHALAHRQRRRLARWQGRLRRTVHSCAVVPTVGVVVFVGAWWWWHMPAVYDAAVANTVVHRFEHATLVAAAAAFWGPIVHPRRTPTWVLPLMLAAAGIAGGLLSALLIFADSPWYAAHQSLAPRWGLSALADQQLAGAIMWVPGGFVYVAAAAASVVRWLHTEDRAACRRPAGIATPPAKPGPAAASGGPSRGS